MVRLAVAMGMAALLGGCTLSRMAAFDPLAARDGLERVAVTSIPQWQDGRFQVGETSGRVWRRDGRDAIGWGLAEAPSAYEAVRIGEAARFGTLAFEIERADLGGRLEARCRYARTEVRGEPFGVEVAAGFRPLRVECAYRIDGRDAGRLEMGAQPPRRIAEPRAGLVRLDGVALAVASTHAIAGLRQESDVPMGYVLTGPDGAVAAAIETNGIGARRMLLPRDPALRRAAVAAMVTLALFWDPGDVG